MKLALEVIAELKRDHTEPVRTREGERDAPETPGATRSQRARGEEPRERG